MVGHVIATVAVLAGHHPAVPAAPVDPPPIINAPCPDGSAPACLLGDTIYLDRHHFASWGRDARYGIRMARLHEYGHVMDGRRLTDAERVEFTVLIRRTDLPWASPNGEYFYPQEQFAEDYARCRVPQAIWPGFSERRVCPVITRMLRDL